MLNKIELFERLKTYPNLFVCVLLHEVLDRKVLTLEGVTGVPKNNICTFSDYVADPMIKHNTRSVEKTIRIHPRFVDQRNSSFTIVNIIAGCVCRYKKSNKIPEAVEVLMESEFFNEELFYLGYTLDWVNNGHPVDVTWN